jgi:RNA polymerase sigma factor (sigma-70 family)
MAALVSSLEQSSPPTADGPATLDGGAFEALFRECAGDLHGYLISLLRPRAWLFAIARNAALDELRRRRRTSSYDAGAGDPVDDRPGDDAFEQAERRATVAEALATLPLRERELVLLKFHGQLSNAELARTMGISESNAGTRLHRALTRLREHCAATEEDQVA